MTSDRLIRPAQGTLTDTSVRPVVDMLSSCEMEDLEDRIVVDLSTVRFARPGGLVPLLTYLETAARANPGRILIICPASDDCLSYLAAANFLQSAADLVETQGDAGYSNRRPGSAETVLPITRITNTHDAGEVRSRVRSSLDQMLGDADASWREVKNAICATVHEMATNVAVHARTQAGWIAAQRYTNYFSGRRYVEFAIGDAGCGIRSSLAVRHTHLASAADDEALHDMLVYGLSSLSGHHGTGYYTLKEAARRYDGTFLLRSGTGVVRRPRSGDQQILQREGSLAAWPGTQLAVSITCA